MTLTSTGGRNKWGRGNFLLEGTPLYFTGPPLVVAFGGCRYNRIVFRHHDFAFFRFLEELSSLGEQLICQEPAKFRPGAISSNKFSFTSFNDPDADELLKCRLLCQMQVQDSNDEKNTTTRIEVPVVEFFTSDGQVIAPHEVSQNAKMQCIFQVSYYREENSFKFYLTVVKGRYQEPLVTEAKLLVLDDTDA